MKISQVKASLTVSCEATAAKATAAKTAAVAKAAVDANIQTAAKAVIVDKNGRTQSGRIDKWKSIRITDTVL